MKIKRILRKMIIVSTVGLSLVSLSACQNAQQRQNAERARVQRDNKDTTLPSGNYFQDDSKQKVQKYQETKALKNVAGQMNQNYKQIADVKYNQSADNISINLKGEQMAQLPEMFKQNNKSATKFWAQMIIGLNRTSHIISKQVQDNNLSFIINGTNGQQLFVTKDGNTQKNVLR